jgi:2-keto-4-pentenoate hydratase
VTGGGDPRLASALAVQLEARRAALAAGAEHVGWKLGVGERERIGGEIAVGHLTSATLLDPGGTYVASEDADLHADAELAVELGRDVDPGEDSHGALRAIAAYGLALELVDLAPLPNEPDSVVTANVFHRAVAFGPMARRVSSEGEVVLTVNGERRASGRPSHALGERLAAAARLVRAAGERLRAGDRIITGSVVQVPVGRGDEIVAELGSVRLSIVLDDRR